MRCNEKVQVIVEEKCTYVQGLLGVCGTAMVVAVLTRKLDLSREEKFVVAYVSDVELGKKVKQHAANVIKHGWLVHKYRSGLGSDYLVLRHQRRLLHSIYRLTATREDRRNLQDSVLTIQEMYTMQNYMYKKLKDTFLKASHIDDRISVLENSLAEISAKLDPSPPLLPAAKAI